jgi:monoamine oxidase
VRLALQTPTRYWEREHLSGFAETDSNSEIWNPTWNSPGTRGVLEIYQEGELAQELDGMREEARLRWGAKLIDQVFPGLEADFAHSVTWSWQQNEWSRGAWGNVVPGQAAGWYPVLPLPEGRIHFAGEHTSANFGYMQGALASGYRAAREITAA